jgi:hypothetical protein
LVFHPPRKSQHCPSQKSPRCTRTTRKSQVTTSIGKQGKSIEKSAAASHATSSHHSPPLQKQAHHVCLRRRSVLGSQEQTFHTRHERQQHALSAEQEEWSIGFDKLVQPSNSEGMHEPTTLSSRSALKWRKSSYLFWMASRSSSASMGSPLIALVPAHFPPALYHGQ